MSATFTLGAKRLLSDNSPPLCTAGGVGEYRREVEYGTGILARHTHMSSKTAHGGHHCVQPLIRCLRRCRYTRVGVRHSALCLRFGRTYGLWWVATSRSSTQQGWCSPGVCCRNLQPRRGCVPVSTLQKACLSTVHALDTFQLLGMATHAPAMTPTWAPGNQTV